MNELERQRLQAAGAKLRYPPGTRVELIHMEDAYAPVPPGARGTVEMVDDAGQLVMAWDNGRGLSLVPGVDSFRKLSPEEVAAERLSMTMGM